MMIGAGAKLSIGVSRFQYAECDSTQEGSFLIRTSK